MQISSPMRFQGIPSEQIHMKFQLHISHFHVGRFLHDPRADMLKSYLLSKASASKTEQELELVLD